MSTRSAYLLLGASLFASVLGASGSGSSTRYWDCCKPSCAWGDKANLLQGPVLTCDRNDNPLSDPDVKSGCENGGSAYTCTNTAPWAVNNDVALGFAATNIQGQGEADWCCGCYKMTFTSGPVKGKVMVVQSVNTGGDLGANHFDLQMPGGGVGIFDGCASQFGQSLPGERYGGISRREQCDGFPELLKDGCQWRFDWFQNADNPTHTFEQVQCPKELVDISGCRRADDSRFPVYVVPSGPGGVEPPKTTKATTTTAASTSSSSSTSVAAEPTPTNDDNCSVPPETEGAPRWGQCGGIGFQGPTTCEGPYTCNVINDWYHQCL